MQAARRIQREADNLQKKPCREFLAYPSEDNAFNWFFTMRGPADTPYERGYYHGKVMLPHNYPYAPPDVLMLTPNGRFETDLKICLSEVTSYHPENWQPSWGVHTVLHALRSFMSTPGTNAVAAIQYPDSEKLRLAEESRTYVSKVGTHVAEHILILDAAPSWEDRESGGSPAKAETAVVPAAVPEAAPVVAPVVVEEVAVQEEEVVEAVGAEVAGAGAAERMVDAVTAAPVASGTWQLNESTLDSLVLFLLMGIFTILSKKYLATLEMEDTLTSIKDLFD